MAFTYSSNPLCRYTKSSFDKKNIVNAFENLSSKKHKIVANVETGTETATMLQ